MKTIEMFIASNKQFSSMYDAALRSLESEVASYPKERWSAINYSVSALYEIFSQNASHEEVPFLIEALCNMRPPILDRKYYFVESECDDPVLISEFDVVKADAQDEFFNPNTGELDPLFRSKIVLRYSLSSEVLANE